MNKAFGIQTLWVRLICVLAVIVAFFSANVSAFALAIPQTDQSKVKLVSGEVYDASYTQWGLRGSMELANVAYNKNVQVCYTYGGSEPVLIDNNTTTCGNASYNKSIAGGKEVWTYDFKIAKTSAPNVQYVLKYTVNGATYWDNNFGKNYGLTPTTSGKTVRIHYATTKATANMHYKIGNGPWTTAPGAKMSDSSFAGYKQLDVEIGTALNITAVFNDGANNWDNNGGSNYLFQQVDGTERDFTLTGNKITIGKPGTTTPVPTATATPVPTATVTPVPTATATPVPTATPTYDMVTVYYKATQANIHYQINNGTWTVAPGSTMISSKFAGYLVQTIFVPAGGTVTAAFNDGKNNWDSNGGKNYKFNVGSSTVTAGVVTSGEPASTIEKKVTIYYPHTYTSRYSYEYLHYRVGGGAWTTAPGVQMAYSDTYMYTSASVDLGTADQLEFCIAIRHYYSDTTYTMNCNDGKNFKVGPGNYSFTDTYDANGNYALKLYVGKPGETTTEPTVPTTPTNPPSSTTSVTVYYATSNTTTNIHYRIDSGAWTAAPGVAMSNSNVSGYKQITIDLKGGTQIQAAFNDGKNNWDSNKGADYKLKAGSYVLKNGVITVGTP